jgi:hypothetical protein
LGPVKNTRSQQKLRMPLDEESIEELSEPETMVEEEVSGLKRQKEKIGVVDLIRAVNELSKTVDGTRKV